ncbi:MAG: hypothetical protein LBI53_08010 [Candidatus Peribacteria bacterium]|nr:hypothetical protein [Candidatus Peribacteria bacterium]
MSDPFEDFAECHNLYLNHNDLFQFFAKRNTNMKSKYNFFANLYGGYYVMNSQVNPTETSSVWRAWDTTRIQE